MAIIRKMEEKDIETVYNIEKDSFSLPWSKGAFANSLDDEFQTFFVFYSDGTEKRDHERHAEIDHESVID